MNLAERLLKAQMLTPEELAPALYRQKKTRGFLAKHLLDLKLIEHLKDQNYLFVKPRDLLTKKNHIPMEMRYALTDAGKVYAEQCLEANRYVGPAPVPLEDYWDGGEAQTIHQAK